MPENRQLICKKKILFMQERNKLRIKTIKATIIYTHTEETVSIKHKKHFHSTNRHSGAHQELWHLGTKAKGRRTATSLESSLVYIAKFKLARAMMRSSLYLNQ